MMTDKHFKKSRYEGRVTIPKHMSREGFEANGFSAAGVAKPMPITFDPDTSFDLSANNKIIRLMVWFAKQTPERITLRQVFGFLMFADQHVRGNKFTMKNLKDIMIPESEYGKPFDTALLRTFNFFFEPKSQEPNALGWLTQVQDTEDGRQKFVRLTDKGVEAYREVLKIIG